MTYPSPENMRSAPVWENYMVAQVVQASLGLIPDSALAVGLQVDGSSVCLVVQLQDLGARVAEDVDGIRTTLEDLVGPEVSVRVDAQWVQERLISPHEPPRDV